MNLATTTDLGVGAVTITANQSADPPGTRNGRVHTSNFSKPGYMIPGSAGALGLTRVVPDQSVWCSTNSQTAALGDYNTANGQADNSNWEGYTGLVSDSLFLII